ncbi:MAG: hypothetical protein BGO31_02730 [Bacteroidetes bacterium 43-16]|nr:MAG: hypothetical protein BGO31_02730 [Bacteroidetes bacterium 43-16]
MKKNLYALFLIIQLFPIIAFAQKKEEQPHSSVAQKMALCESILSALSGKPAEIEQLIATGTAGLREAGNNQKAQFVFYQSIGIGYYYQQNFEKAKQNFQQAYQVASGSGMVEQSLKPLGNLIHINHYLGLQEEADHSARLLQNIVATTDTLKKKGDAYYNLGLYYQQQKFYYSTALNYFLKSAALHKPLADTTHNLKLKLDYATKLMMVAEIYIYLKQADKALEYLEKVKPYLNQSIIVDITAYGKFIRSYALKNDKQAALKYYNLLSESVEKNPGKWSELVSSNLKMAELSLSEHHYTQAKSYIDKADKQAKLDNKEILTSSVNQSYGDYYRSMKDFGTAIKYYKMAERGSKQYNKEQYADLLRSLTEALIHSGNATEAQKYYDQYIALNDTLTQQKLDLNLAEMEAVFQNKDKQQQIEVQQSQLSDATQQRFWLIGGLALLALIVLLLIIIYRNKKNTADLFNKKNLELASLNEDLELANQTKAKLFSIISHDLRSPVSQVNAFLKLQQKNAVAFSETERLQYNEMIQSATASLLETMEDLLAWSKSQMNQFQPQLNKIDLNEPLSEVLSLMQLHIAAKNLKINNTLPAQVPVLSDENFLKTILRNLLQNAIKASTENATITLAFAQHVFSIINAGQHFSQAHYEQALTEGFHKNALNGLGLKIVDELSRKIQLQVTFDNTFSSGTKADLFFGK